MLHFGEEPPITGTGGSGTVFFSGCTLQCGCCQNWQISRGGVGAPLTSRQLSQVFLLLEEAGAGNMNIVTGSQFAPAIVAAYRNAQADGLSIPMVWNSSGYETSEVVSLVSPHVRFFLPDLKTLDPALASRWFHAADYPSKATRAILEMTLAVPMIDDTQGVIVRHLVLPGNLDDTRAVLAWFAGNLRGKAMLSLMFQYTPIPGTDLVAPSNRMVSPEEYDAAVGMLEEFSLEDGFVQEPETDNQWLPDFTQPRPFPSGKSKVVWHWKDGAPS